MAGLIDRQEAIDQAWGMGYRIEDAFQQPELEVHIKADGTPVTKIGQDVSDATVAFYDQHDRNVVSEEKDGTAEYGDPDAEYVDPDDDTEDFLAAHKAGTQSRVAFSVGSAVAGRLERGIINLPLLSIPRLYWAERGVGAYRIMNEDDDREIKLTVAEGSKGIVLVTDQPGHAYVDRLQSAGFTTVGLGGAIMKACCVADPTLLNDYMPGQFEPDEAVIGFVSSTAQPHDYAGADVLVSSAEGFGCGWNGLTLPLTAGKHGCVFANNETTRDRILEAINAK